MEILVNPSPEAQNLGIHDPNPAIKFSHADATAEAADMLGQAARWKFLLRPLEGNTFTSGAVTALGLLVGLFGTYAVTDGDAGKSFVGTAVGIVVGEVSRRVITNRVGSWASDIDNRINQYAARLEGEEPQKRALLSNPRFRRQFRGWIDN
jgi:hypothetical protein